MITLFKEELPIDEEFIIKYDNSEVIKNSVIEILSATPISNPMAYVKEIKEHSIKRQINDLAINIKKINFDENINSTELLNIIETEYEKVVNNNSFNFLNATPMNQIVEEDTEYVCKNYIPIPKYGVTLISARGGTGKTFAAIRLADEIIKEDKNRKVLLVASEDRKGKIKSRALKLKINNPSIEISDIMPFDVLEKDYKTQNWKPTEEFYKFKKEMKNYDVIIIDPLISFYSGKENDNGDAKKFMLQFTNLCAKYNKTIVFLHHAGKNETGTRGAGAFADASRLAYFVTKDYEKTENGIQEINNNELRFEIEKENDNIKSIKKLDNLKKVSGIGSFSVEVFPKVIEIEYVNKSKQKEKKPYKDESREDIMKNFNFSNILD